MQCALVSRNFPDDTRVLLSTNVLVPVSGFWDTTKEPMWGSVGAMVSDDRQVVREDSQLCGHSWLMYSGATIRRVSLCLWDSGQHPEPFSTHRWIERYVRRSRASQ